MDGTRQSYWIAPKNLHPIPPKNFRGGEQVMIAERAGLHLNSDLFATCLTAEADDDSTKVKELRSRGNEGFIRLEKSTVAKIVAANNAMQIYRVEGTLPGGSPFRHWVMGYRLTPYTSGGNPKAELSRIATPSQPALIFPNSGDTINEADIDSLEDIVKAIYDGSVSVQVASRYGYRFGDLAVEHCKFSHVAGEFLIFRLTAVGDGQLEFAMRRDPVLEREEAITNLIEGGDEDLIVDGKALALGAIRVTGVEQFTTANGLVKVIPIVTFVP